MVKTLHSQCREPGLRSHRSQLRPGVAKKKKKFKKEKKIRSNDIKRESTDGIIVIGGSNHI